MEGDRSAGRTVRSGGAQAGPSVFHGTMKLMLPPIPKPTKLKLDEAALGRLSGVELAQTVAQFKEWEDIHRANPLLGYEPAGLKHHEVHMSRERVRAIFGGNRAGKTTTAGVDNLLCMTPAELVPPHLRVYRHGECPFYLRIVIPDMKRTGQVIRDFYRQWTPRALLKQGSFDRSYDKNQDVLRLECGCFVELMSVEMDLNKFGGSSRHRIHYDEEPPELYRTESALRLVDTGGDELFSMTPLNGLSYAFHKIWKRRNDPGYAAWTIGMRDNRMLTKDAIDHAMGLIDNEAERAQREFGIFGERGGQIYTQFLTRKRSAPAKEDIRGLDIRCGIDPGIRFSGLVWAAFDRDGKAFVFAAAKLSNADVDRVASVIRRVNASWGLIDDELTYVIDPSAVNRNLVTGQSYEMALNLLGFSLVHGQNNVEAGIELVRRMLRVGWLHYSEQLSQLEDEAMEYAWEERDDGKAVPVKKNDHLLDPLRYLMMSRPPQLDTQRVVLPSGADYAAGPNAVPQRDSVMGVGV